MASEGEGNGVSRGKKKAYHLENQFFQLFGSKRPNLFSYVQRKIVVWEFLGAGPNPLTREHFYIFEETEMSYFRSSTPFETPSASLPLRQFLELLLPGSTLSLFPDANSESHIRLRFVVLLRFLFLKQTSFFPSDKTTQVRNTIQLIRH